MNKISFLSVVFLLLIFSSCKRELTGPNIKETSVDVEQNQETGLTEGLLIRNDFDLPLELQPANLGVDYNVEKSSLVPLASGGLPLFICGTWTGYKCGSSFSIGQEQDRKLYSIAVYSDGVKVLGLKTWHQKISTGLILPPKTAGKTTGISQLFRFTKNEYIKGVNTTQDSCTVYQLSFITSAKVCTVKGKGGYPYSLNLPSDLHVSGFYGYGNVNKITGIDYYIFKRK